MQIVDISRDITKCEIYPGDPPVRLETVSSMENGDECNLSAIYTGLHNGTHVDAPLHFISGGDSVEKADLSAFIGECHVIEVPEGAVTGEYIDDFLPSGVKRLLIKGGGKAWLHESAATELALRGVRLVGTDALSVGTQGAQTRVHRALLREGVAILENLELKDVKCGRYFLLAQPLKIGSAEAAPARAVLIGDIIFWSGTKF